MIFGFTFFFDCPVVCLPDWLSRAVAYLWMALDDTPATPPATERVSQATTARPERQAGDT